MVTKYCKTEQEIVDCLLQGGHASSDRGAGKTTGLLITVHLRHRGEAAIAVHCGMMRDYLREQYRRMFPQDTQPKIFVGTPQRLLGFSRPLYVDEFRLLKPEAQDLILHLGYYFCGATE